jgi:hypothetical protein
MLVRDSRTSSANGALGRHEQHESAGLSCFDLAQGQKDGGWVVLIIQG